MRRRRIPFEALLGRLVRDVDGAPVGRIHEARADWSGERCVVVEWHLGRHAVVERLGVRMLALFGQGHRRQPIRVPAALLDLADPERPRLRCRREELAG